MVVSNPPIPPSPIPHSPQPWHQALSTPAQEFTTTPLKILSGKIPTALRGNFYQNGTGRLERGGQPVSHWFDGDGAILRVGFNDGQATGTYRYVQTKGYQEESEANQFLYGNYGRKYPGPLWKHLVGIATGNSVKNSANTSVLALPDKLLALWEAGNPHSLDLTTLETKGIDSLDWLKSTQPFSAHPLQDPISQEIYSIGVTPMGEMSIYRCNAHCQLIKQRKLSLKGILMVHSFAMAGPYLVFLISPITVDTPAILLNQKAFADAAQWEPNRGTRILIVDRETLETVSDTTTDAWFQWHYGNGCVESDGNIKLNFAKFDDFTHINQVLREVPTGNINTKAYGRLWQLRIDPKTGKIINSECTLDRDCEFPQVPSAQVGQPWQHTYVMMHRESVNTGEDWFGAIGRIDEASDALIQTDLGEGCYASEPLHVTDKTGKGWVVVVVFNAIANPSQTDQHPTDQTGRSEIWILDADTLGEPICRLALPSIVPLGFHGTWKSA